MRCSDCRGGFDHPGAALNKGALYGIPIVAASSHPLAPAALGAAEGAYEIFLDSMAKRAGTYTGAKVADFQAVQIKVARARSLIDSARYLLRQSAIAFDAYAARGDVPDLETKLRFRAHSAFAVNQSREAVETLWSCYGAQGLYRRDPLQRHLRDAIAIAQHFSFNFDIAGAGLWDACARRRVCQSDDVRPPSSRAHKRATLKSRLQPRFGPTCRAHCSRVSQ